MADTLEAEWNEALRQLSEVQESYEKQRQLDSTKLQKAEQDKILNLAKDFPKLWKNPKTPGREKKRMIRFVLEDVTLIKTEEITVHVRFKGGANKILKIPLPPKGWQYALTRPEIVKEIDILLDNHCYTQIATILNERGYKSGHGLPFDAKLVGSIRANYDLRTRYARLRNIGKLTATEIADILGVTKGTIWKWKNKGLLKTYPYNDRNECLYEHPGVNSPLMKKRT